MTCAVHTFPFPDRPDHEAVVIIYEVRGTKFATYYKHAKVDGASKRFPNSFADTDLKFLCDCRDRVVSELQAEGQHVDGFAKI